MLNFLQNRPLCLASSSPRRKMFLKKYNLEFECKSPDIEEIPRSNESAKNFVKRMAYEKAKHIQEKFYNFSNDIVIISGDTIVSFDGQILGKPSSLKHAKRMLKELNEKTHKVFSGFTILDSQSVKTINKVICTKVKFLKLDDEIIEWYVNSGEPFGKAGAYSIQGLGAFLVESISGSYNNVVGFPIEFIFPYLKNNGCISFRIKRK